jgi:hypothetical protein
VADRTSSYPAGRRIALIFQSDFSVIMVSRKLAFQLARMLMDKVRSIGYPLRLAISAAKTPRLSAGW